MVDGWKDGLVPVSMTLHDPWRPQRTTLTYSFSGARCELNEDWHMSAAKRSSPQLARRPF